MRRLKVLIADDHRLMLKAMRLSLEESEDLEVVGEATSGSQVLPMIAQTQPDLALIDIRMPGMDGLMALELIRNRYPKIKVVMISGLDEPDVIKAALRRGAAAFIAKTIDPRDLAGALRQANEGTVFQALGIPEEDEASVAKEAGLSKREMSILKALGSGLSNKQIAKELWLAEQTVKFHLTNIYRKLGVANRTEAVRYAYRHGLVESPLFEQASTV
jgi:DNA-binding NarL/FixJ family response regulator